MDIEKKLDDIEEASGVDPSRGGLKLSVWEEDFLESVKDQLDDGGHLSEKQESVIQKIWDRI